MTLEAGIEGTCRAGLVTFRIGGRCFAVPIVLVREINRQLQMTPVHRAPASVRGLVNLRGQIVTVMDLGRRLGLGPVEIGEKSRMVVLKENSMLRGDVAAGLRTAEDSIGFLVDEIADILTPEDRDLESPPPNLDQTDGRHVVAVCKTEESIVSVLNPAAIIRSEIQGPPAVCVARPDASPVSSGGE
ncbi:MAG: purine-binding chemotaxis protein CheW [Spirochaetaceae bacterium]|nr:purine-binding chemotaxis protein CheW [Spirochaetaceae bacterium]